MATPGYEDRMGSFTSQGNKDENWLTGWQSRMAKARESAAGPGRFHKIRALQNERQTRDLWTQQGIDAEHKKAAGLKLQASVDKTQAAGLEGIDQGLGTLQGFEGKLAGWEDQARGDLEANNLMGIGLYEPFRNRGLKAGEFIDENAYDPHAYQRNMVGYRADDAIDKLMEKESRSRSNAAGHGGWKADQKALWANQLSGMTRQEGAERALANQLGMAQNMYDTGANASTNMSNLYGQLGTSLANTGVQFANLGGNVANNIANTQIGRGNFIGTMEGMRGAIGAGQHDWAIQRGYGDAQTAYKQGDANNTWNQNAQLQNFLMDKQIAADKSNANKQFMLGALEGGVNLLTAGTGGGIAGGLGKMLLG